MQEHASVPVEKLYRHCDPAQFTFKTTEELPDLNQLIGQDRAFQAMEFGSSIQREGYNLFVMGPPGLGKHTMVRQVLGQKSAKQPVPQDICYVHNFDQPHMPRSMLLPAGKGKVLKQDMNVLIETLRSTIPAAFESEQYRDKIQEIQDEIKREEEEAFFALQQESLHLEVKLFRTPTGFTFAPLIDGKVIGPKEFQALPEKERQAIEDKVGALQNKLEELLRHTDDLRKESRKKVKHLNREVTMFAVGSSIKELEKRFEDLPAVQDYLKAVQQDVIDNASDFRHQEEQAPTLFDLTNNRPSFRRYEVNVMVDHTESEGAPLVYEDFPTFSNLVGRIEHTAHLGTLLTDFTHIKAGALHKANGGFLLVDARKVLTQPFAWEVLKRSLQSHKITITSPSELYGLVSTVSLEPEPIPLDVKLVLVGERILYYLLCELDPEFSELFKVAADFEEEIDWNDANMNLYARLIATLARKDKLMPLDAGGVARIVEASARMVEDAEKFSTHVRNINDLLKEADFWAVQRQSKLVQAEDVQKALEMQVHRVSRVHELIQEEIRRGTILIDTAAQRVGTVNGLSVMQMGNHMFGQPSRITATVRMGDGEVVDIEREVELGGSVHSKGVMILSSYLSSTYAKDHPLSLNASLVFEQSYSQIDGDSASVAELCAILSAIANVAIKQSIAITGSVNQLGQAQAIGGVNEKIEGFFNVCQQRGLDGGQGVIIPESNIKHLMLRQDVVDAVSKGQFRIYSMSTVHDAMEILTGVSAGERDAEGQFPEGSLNRMIEDRLLEIAHIKYTYKHEQDKDEDKDKDEGEDKDRNDAE